MSKKVVVILSVLALLFAGAAGGLWYTINGKLDQDATAIGSLKEFGTSTYADRLKAPGKAAAEVTKQRGIVAERDETILAKESKITGLEKTKKEVETERDDLNTKVTELTRARDDLKTKSDEFQASAAKAETRVKDLEAQATKQVAEFAAKEEELSKQINADKAGLLGEVEKTRQWYSQIYNFSSHKGLQMPLPARPWDTVVKQTGPQFDKNVFLAEVIGFDARQAIIVLNVGSASDLTRQGFNLVVGDTVVAKVMITEILNGGISTASITSGTPNLTVGTAVKLVPAVEAAPAPVAPVAPAPAAAAAAK